MLTGDVTTTGLSFSEKFHFFYQVTFKMVLSSEQLIFADIVGSCFAPLNCCAVVLSSCFQVEQYIAVDIFVDTSSLVTGLFHSKYLRFQGTPNDNIAFSRLSVRRFTRTYGVPLRPKSSSHKINKMKRVQTLLKGQKINRTSCK